ncbi:MAG: MarR family winged helix-turn-helix transcriptional regulator [Solirubrobacterales bacterium]
MPRDQALVPERRPPDAKEEQPPFPPALMERIGFLLTMTKGGAHSICSRALAPLDLPVRQFGLLTVLDTEGPQSQQALVEWTRLDRTTMVAQVDALEERGLVRRERNPDDRRAYLVRLTPEGREVLRRAQPAMANAEKELLASLSASEKEQLLELLAKVAADIGRPPPEVTA